MGGSTEHRYFYTKRFRIAMNMAAGVLILSPIPFLILPWPGFSDGLMPMLVLTSTILLGILFAVISNRPVCILSDDYIKIMNRTYKWEDFKSAEVSGTKGFLKNPRQLFLEKRSRGVLSLPVRIPFDYIQDHDEMLSRIEEKLSGPGEYQGSGTMTQQEVLREVRYNRLDRPVRNSDTVFQPEGIRLPNKSIPWQSVSMVEYQSDAITGFGATYVTYADGGHDATLVLEPKSNRAYQACILYLFQYAGNARFDPYLVKVLDLSPNDAKADTAAVGLVIAGFLMLIPAWIILLRYSLKETPHTPYFFLLGGLSFTLPVVALMLYGRVRGRSAPVLLKLSLAALVPGGTVASIAALFLASPASLHLMRADYHEILRHAGEAEAEYFRALDAAPGSIDVSFEIGQFYLDRYEYEKALPHLEDAYAGDVEYWGLYLMELIPGTYEKLGRYEEAIQWCDRIIRDHEGTERIVKPMKELRERLSSKNQARNSSI